MALSVDILANTRQAQSNVKDLSKEFDKVADSLDDMARDADRNADKVERSFREMSRAAEKLDDSVRDIKPDPLRKLGDAGEEVSGELKQNLGETFSSFRGDLEDLPQVAQDVFGGLAGSVGGLGASLALAGGAAGIGLLIAGFQEIQKQEEERQQRIADWTAAYIGGLSTMEGALADFATVEAIYTDKDRYAEAVKNAKNWHVSTSDAINAMAGDMTALGVVEDNLASNSQTVSDAIETVGGNTRGLSHEMRTLKDETSQGYDAFNKLTGEMSAGAARADEYSQSLLNIVSHADNASIEIDAVGNSVFTLPDGKQVLIDAQTGKATADLSKFKGDADGIINSVNGRDVVLNLNAAVWNAQQAVNRFMSDNDGRSFTMYGRVKVDSGGTWD
ncbi:hypothetical protein LXM50_01610 [Microbacterium sp. Au-Mic1]|uniref:hypothetical protein n=1 Tax=Microbacterium sp. Au-Mic1 TaxID=2906457 RepID=UPI001E3C140E|nr:hypothetical protein [Microbacterium sp. Au-Mic1]MCE4024663.1 hypothetical protein [Microbacterium sp. Au-Mic1]